jgi:HK97 family phage major capsid protein
MENFNAETTFEQYLEMVGVANFEELAEEEQAKLVQAYQDELAKLVKQYEEEDKKNKTQISVMKNQMEVGFKEISKKIEKMKKAEVSEKKAMVSKLREFIYEHKTEVLEALKGGKPFPFTINKSAIVVGTSNTIGASGSASQLQLSQNTDIVAPIRSRVLTYLDSGVSAGNLSINEPFVIWTEELDEQGAPVFHNELATTPLASVRYEERKMEAKTISVMGTITKNMERYLDNLVRYFERNLLKRVDLKTESELFIGDGLTVNLKGLLSYAVAFDGGAGVSGDEVLKVKDPNESDVLRALIQQCYNSYGNPTAIFVKPSTLGQIDTQKAEDGHYIKAPFMSGGTEIMGMVKLIPTNVLVGTDFDFVGGDLSVVNVDFLVDEIEIGHNGTDFQNRRKSILWERQLTQFVSANDTQVLIKGDFVSAKALIELT